MKKKMGAAEGSRTNFSCFGFKTLGSGRYTTTKYKKQFFPNYFLYSCCKVKPHRFFFIDWIIVWALRRCLFSYVPWLMQPNIRTNACVFVLTLCCRRTPCQAFLRFPLNGVRLGFIVWERVRSALKSA